MNPTLNNLNKTMDLFAMVVADQEKKGHLRGEMLWVGHGRLKSVVFEWGLAQGYILTPTKRSEPLTDNEEDSFVIAGVKCKEDSRVEPFRAELHCPAGTVIYEIEFDNSFDEAHVLDTRIGWLTAMAMLSSRASRGVALAKELSAAQV